MRDCGPGGVYCQAKNLPFVKPHPVCECNWQSRWGSLSAFHEKAGMSQVCFSPSVFSFLPVDSLHSSQAASVAILPSALLVERFSLGAWWAFPFSRCCYLIIDLCSPFRRKLVQALSQSPDLGG